MKKISKSITNLILLISIVLLMLILVSRLFRISIFGYYFCIINSESMEPAYKKNSLVIVRKEEYEDIEIGDVILFKSTVLSNKLILHRVVDEVQGGYLTKGDQTNSIDDGIITKSEYLGKPILHTNTIAIFLVWLKKSYILLIIIISLFFILKLYFKRRKLNA